MNKINNKITLLIDADDTLWNNNIYFEEAIFNFIAKIIQKTKKYSFDKIKENIMKNERILIKSDGYGSKSFAKSLKLTLEQLLPDMINIGENELKSIYTFIDDESKKIFNHPINLFDGVEKHLSILKQNYFNILVTKGNFEEQSNKIERANIKNYFHHIEVVPEKDPNTYKKIVEKYKLNKKYTWMIGNSPNSDINPAKEIGLNTILIPYELTWELEKGKIKNIGPETKILEKFTEIHNYINSTNNSI